MVGKTNSTDITVRLATGTYLTSTVRGQRASCSHSQSEAASRLGRKLYGDGFQRAEQIPGGGGFISVWRLHGIGGGRNAIL